MVDSDREYVLQWPGHAAYVTERFSGLLARQTLVDVTLLCEEQKLRVHKLVLASCSLYFEEILTEDIGAEPIILLRDLEFSVLKAMIEFMYCGETTVSHVHLPSLLTAARLFKVKELESLVEKMVGSISPDHNDNDKEYSPKSDNPPGRINGLVNTEGDNGIRVSFTNKHNGHVDYDGTESETTECEEEVYFEETSGNLSDTTERCLYEDLPCKLEPRENSVESACDSSSTLYSERCCDLVRENGYEDKDEEEINKVGQCSKTYMHKKRKNSVNGADKIKRGHTPVPQQQVPSSNRIDLTDDETTVTLTEDLNTESPEYDLRYSTESIISIIGCSTADYSAELLSERTRLYLDNDDAEEHEEEEEEGSRPPVLRRSVRLNQQEAEETNTTSSPPRLRSKLKDDKKHVSKPSKIKLLANRTKRKSKELERRVTPNGVKIIFSQTKKNTQKKTSTAPTTKKNQHIAKPTNKSSIEQSKLGNSIEVTETTNHEHPVKPNTPSSSVNRALWGDMTDVNEDGEVDHEFMEYSTSAEIPFAVGLLPLRAALERMQATLDHQPRKTRSSVLMTKQDSNSLKRKNSPIPASSNKRQNTNTSADSEVEENPSAVCHIQIRTETSPRKRSLSDGAAASSLGQTTGNS